ncbi:MAG TPA: MaoC family dehydratase, partial [Burkholderiaceae bacterium]
KLEYTIADLPGMVGKPLGTSAWLEITQAQVNTFAECTHDHQWIHVDVERCKRESPFGGPIAHGYLTLSLLAGWSAEIGIAPRDAKAVLNYGLDKARFIAPVLVGAKIRVIVTVTDVTDQGRGRWLVKLNNTVEIEGSEKPALVAETLAVFVG